MYPQGVDGTASGYLSVLLVRDVELPLPLAQQYRGTRPVAEKLVDCSFSLILRAGPGATDKRTERTSARACVTSGYA